MCFFCTVQELYGTVMLRESLANGLIFEGSSTYVQQNAGPNSQLQLLCVGANTSQINDNFLPPKLHLQKKYM